MKCMRAMCRVSIIGKVRNEEVRKSSSNLCGKSSANYFESVCDRYAPLVKGEQFLLINVLFTIQYFPYIYISCTYSLFVGQKICFCFHHTTVSIHIPGWSQQDISHLSA
jgi:hypothetical protein